jgi:hypothetical protein
VSSCSREQQQQNFKFWIHNIPVTINLNFLLLLEFESRFNPFLAQSNRLKPVLRYRMISDASQAHTVPGYIQQGKQN